MTILCSVVFVLWSGSLHAQAFAGEAKRTEAQAHFERGVVLARAGEYWDAALAEFIASRELYPTKSATRNAAVALRQLHRPAEALDYYASLLSEFSSSMPADELEAVRKEMSGLKELVGELAVQTQIAGARVVIDGRHRGTTPLSEPLRLDTGTHTLRLSKDGFEAVEVAVSVARGQHKSTTIALEPLKASGTLVVREANGAALDVVLDSAVVGKSPWTGSVAPGLHSVLLRGRQLGTAPSAAEVKLDEITSLTLRALRLEASLLVEPAPSNASVYVDGVSVGNGIWEGHLPSGTHRVEVAAKGHLPFRRELNLSAQQREVVHARLDRDLSSPLWKDAFHPHAYAEMVLGAVLAPSLHGAADDACGCREHSTPIGAMLGLRVGFSPLAGAGLELNGGYLTISEAMTRRVRGAGETDPWESSDYRDTTDLGGLFAALSASYRMLEKTPITARMGLGVAALSAHTTNSGTFTTILRNPQSSSETLSFSSKVAIDEIDSTLLTPFATTEIRAGYRISKRISIDLGASLFLFLPARQVRGGANSFSTYRTRTTAVDSNAKWSTGNAVQPGNVELPEDEVVAGPFLAFSPSIAARWDF